MSIVFVNRYFYPDHAATSQILSDLAFHLARQGVIVSVIASRQRYDDPDACLARNEIVEGVEIHRVGGTQFGRHAAPGRLLDYASFVLGARKALSRLVDQNTVVVAKTDPPMLGMFLSSVVKKKGGKLVNWLQDLFPETLTALAGGRVVRFIASPALWLRNRNLTAAAVNVVIGERMRRYLVESGVPSDKLRVIHNWAHGGDGNESDDRVGTADLKKKWGLSDRFVVGYFGNLGRAHEFETVLAAMRAMAEEQHIVFLFVGGGIGMEELGQIAEEEGLPNFVYREYVPRSMLTSALKVPDAHLVILRPSLEGLIVPSKFAGVAAASRPVIYVGDRDGELGRTVTEAGCGYVVDVGNSEDLAGRIREMAGDRGAAQRMGDNAARVYSEQYRSKVQLEKWRQVLTSLAQSASKRSVEIQRGDRI